LGNGDFCASVGQQLVPQDVVRFVT
jgi:hypothetical protein